MSRPITRHLMKRLAMNLPAPADKLWHAQRARAATLCHAVGLPMLNTADMTHAFLGATRRAGYSPPPAVVRQAARLMPAHAAYKFSCLPVAPATHDALRMLAYDLPTAPNGRRSLAWALMVLCVQYEFDRLTGHDPLLDLITLRAGGETRYGAKIARVKHKAQLQTVATT